MLYSTNAVHISNVLLMRFLPSLLLPQRLSSVTSLELVWDLSHLWSLLDPHEKCWPAYSGLASIVASAFPHLRKLYISVDIRHHMTNPSAEIIESDERQLLGPIDEIVRKLGPQLQDCEVALACYVHIAFMDRAKSAGARIKNRSIGGLRCTRFWRPVAVDQGAQSGNDLGYWVRPPVEDQICLCTCFTSA